MSFVDSSISLVPRRRASLHHKPRPVTSCGVGQETRNIPSIQASRLSFIPGNGYDVLDLSTFEQEQQRQSKETVPRHVSGPYSRPNDPLPSRQPRVALQRQPSILRQGLSELRAFGHRLSVTMKGMTSKQKEETENKRLVLAPFKSDSDMMEMNEALSYRPKSRGWLYRRPVTRRQRSLPLLNCANERFQYYDTAIDPISPPSRGRQFLTDFMHGGDGARASAAAQNEFYKATRTPPLPPYEPAEPKAFRDSESGIGITIDSLSRSSSFVSAMEPFPVYRDPTTVLATEVVEYIFSYLDAPSLLNAGSVSRKWRGISQSQAVWHDVFYRKYHVLSPNPYARLRTPAGLGKNIPGQDFLDMYKIRTLIDKRWENGEAAAIYLNGHKDSVYCVQFDEQKIITGSRDNTIRIWDAHTYQCIRKLGPKDNLRERHNFERPPVEPEGVLPFFKADVTSPDPVPPPLAHYHQASVLCLQYDEDILATGSSDCTCIVWSIRDNYKPMFRLVGHQAGVLDVCIDRHYVVTCSKDTTIKIWNRTTGALVRTLFGHRGPVNAVQVRGNLLASASGDGTSKLWRIDDGMCIKEFPSEDRGLACVEFSEDGRTIFTGGKDRVIYEYDTVTGHRVRELKGHGELVRSLHLDSANSRIVSGSYDHSIKVWNAKRGESAQDGGLMLDFQGWTSSWMLAAKSNYRKIVCTSQDARVLIIDFGYGIHNVESVEA